LKQEFYKFYVCLITRGIVLFSFALFSVNYLNVTSVIQKLLPDEFVLIGMILVEDIQQKIMNIIISCVSHREADFLFSI
jgi:hypothetical protein